MSGSKALGWKLRGRARDDEMLKVDEPRRLGWRISPQFLQVQIDRQVWLDIQHHLRGGDYSLADRTPVVIVVRLLTVVSVPQIEVHCHQRPSG